MTQTKPSRPAAAPVAWSANQYLKFEDERTRPVRDLLAAVPTREARRVVDLGCGPGNSTALLIARWPGAAVHAIDSSDDMVRAARQRVPRATVELADIATWRADGPWDVMLANAVLQWVPDHASLLSRLAAALAPGGSLAIQMPDNLAEPCHRLMERVAHEGPWRAKLAGADIRTRLESADGYYAWLRPRCARVDIWRTTYHHPLAGIDGVVEWFKGSALRPFLAPLAAEDQAAFLRRYRDLLAGAYRTQPDGVVLLPFPRLFVVATR
ncbi:MAG: trans-aconitate 2-methyltransferase [Alphaproteobacteria bacterium]|nr:trans-aconitate 2-methyltransferase [Alphaproteobacteria bacterium]